MLIVLGEIESPMIWKEKFNPNYLHFCENSI